MVLNVIALGLVLSSIIIIILGIIAVHTYPARVATARDHPQAKAIEVTALLGLIAFPLWMLALIWAHSKPVVADLSRAAASAPGEAPAPTRAPSDTDS